MTLSYSGALGHIVPMLAFVAYPGWYGIGVPARAHTREGTAFATFGAAA